MPTIIPAILATYANGVLTCAAGSSSLTLPGFEFGSDGAFSAVAVAEIVGAPNLQSADTTSSATKALSDGPIMQFRRDNVIVGSILASAGSVTYVGDNQAIPTMVAQLPKAAGSNRGQRRYCSDLRVMTSGGAIEAAGAGWAGTAESNGAAWHIAGTNIAVQA